MIYRIIFFLLILCEMTFPQQASKIFFNSWVDRDFYNCITSGGTPVECTLKKPAKYLYFIPGTDSVLIASFVEGLKVKYSVKDPDTLIISRTYNPKIKYVITLSPGIDAAIILEEPDNVKTELVALDKKYYEREGAVRFVNDRYFSGIYTSGSDSSIKVTFTGEGKVSGIKDYDRYKIGIMPVEGPFFESVIFYKGRNYQEIYHWKRTGSKLTLYNLSEGEEGNNTFFHRKITDKYLELTMDK